MTELRRWAVGYVETGGPRKSQPVDDGTSEEVVDATIAVAKRLQRSGIEVYCPRFRKPVRQRHRWHRRKRECIVKALFPAYIFANVDTIGNMEAVYRTQDFRYFIRNHGNLSLLPDSAIDALRALEARGILVASAIRELVSQFLAGDLVRVEGGPLHDYTGSVQSQEGSRVDLDVGGVTVNVDAATLRIANG